MRAPERYCDHLTEQRYNSRSSKHGDFLSQAFLADLLGESNWLRRAAKACEIVYRLNHNVKLGGTSKAKSDHEEDLSWNIDLALGPGEPERRSRKSKPLLLPEDLIRYGKPSEEWLMLDAKGVMTEHGKARRNRQRDVTALWAVMHSVLPESVVGALIPINIAHQFRSSLRGGATTTHRNIETIVKATLSVFRAVKRRTSEVGDTGIEGLGYFVIDYTNKASSTATLRTKEPAPKASDPLHYERFLQSMVASLEDRYRIVR